ncbi:pirin family protein [Solitalea canadensis]|uniref:Pirin-related protein n=1 Tax=Solitalea canadensis (strain ATCC 29591 / DSM 3403 / JCM 21819 / LMG 8368 / NBRC 15130 / NCIMB 12057 / USAM 9D) TaxID=929556 RepID=H8KSP0_SOLCM|nr:pirin family protein [Solitalea canadensis]AFD05184.1 Pirin-related protein [Solitalea canadensis DSM 3403]
MKTRSVSAVLPAFPIDMDGVPVKQVFPTQKIERIDPFLLLHHLQLSIPKYVIPEKAGVSPHPHRGFSPVTFIFKGGVHHRDSRGNNSVIYEGGTQWMNAGMGIMHSERPPKNIQELGGEQELIQLWINTPKAHKMDQPQYLPLTPEETPVVKSDDEKIEIQVVAGNLNDIKGGIPTLTPVNAFVITAHKGGKQNIQFPTSHNAFIYLLDGRLKIDGFGLVEGLNAVKFNNDGDGIGFEALENTRALLMTAAPINEPVVAQGPFVMNSESEILEAMRDYRMGKMGILIED